MPKRGRPSSYTEEKANEICSILAQDEGSLRSICAREDMPSTDTVLRWLNQHEDFRARYARARLDQAHASVHRMREIEDKILSGELEPNAARVVLDSIKWRASKLGAKVYGDRIQHSGDPDAPIQHAVALDFSSLKPAERNALRGILEARQVEDAVPIEGEKSS